MGAVSSRPDDGQTLFLRDQSRLHITNARGHVLLRVTPNAFPASRYTAQRDHGDDSIVDYVQDPESSTPNATPAFLLRLNHNDELNFHFTFVIRQSDAISGNALSSAAAAPTPMDTTITGLTYIFASNQKEVDNLVVREFHSDPNLHKNPHVQLVGDFGTHGNHSVQTSWTWKWRPPKSTEDRGGGWRNTCSFLEYDQRAHRLNTLVSFSFWVQSPQRLMTPNSPRLELGATNRLRIPSAQSIESRVSNISDSEGEGSYRDMKDPPQSPTFEPIPENSLGLVPTLTTVSGLPSSTVKVDVATCKPGDDPSINDDGPVFRATMRSLEQKTGNMRLRMKKVLRMAEAAEAAQQACNQAVTDFTEALKEAASSNANAVKPAIEHYFEKIAREILRYERQNTVNLQRLIIEPLSKLYNIEIKQAEFKKREFDEESKEYYAYVSKYLGQRSESLKEKKQKSDEKYQAKRKTFELKRFDYSSFIHDLHGGRKDQEVLSQLTKYADAQARGFLATAKTIGEMVPQLDALIAEVKVADQDFQLQRTEREEKRRMLEKDGLVTVPGSTASSGLGIRGVEIDASRPASLGGPVYLSQSPPGSGTPALQGPPTGLLTAPRSNGQAFSASPGGKFKGFRDLEENSNTNANGGLYRKEGLLWALSRPGLHVDPKGITKPGWHKFWIVLDQGRLSEYVNWKERLDLHMEPIDLRVASVREARNSDRRFCFEVITPHYTRVYQAPSEEDMKSWISSINNALQTAFEAKASPEPSRTPHQTSSTRKDIAAVLTGKSSSFSGHRQTSNPNRHEANKAVNRHATVGDKPTYQRSQSTDAESTALLMRIRNADAGNKICADCGSDSKVDWCSINLGVLLCIECSGIHRSLGTHISKVRSLTLDTSAFTPDIIEILLLIGNRVSNMIWEAKLDHFLKPSPHSTRDQRLHFITAKYSERTYVRAVAANSTQSPDEQLLTSIKRNDIQNVLQALALRADPNAHDRSRSTHAVFLALAAADPASPASALSTPLASSRNSISGRPVSPAPTPRKPFAVAELLLQNGADVPLEQSPFPLSSAAQLYLDFKHEQRLGRISQTPTKNRADDAQPRPFSGSAGNPTTSGDGLRERERLLQRHSGGRPVRPNSTVDMLENFVKK